ncbi:MAG TPA: hypothetical protein VFJ02_06570 [Vicinamibacterales bacterium]|nr:hypothetical protein [Vicinamibacterales bacterium]
MTVLTNGTGLATLIGASVIALGCMGFTGEARAQEIASTPGQLATSGLRVRAVDDRLLAALPLQVPIGSWRLHDVDESLWRDPSQIRGIPRRPPGQSHPWPGTRRASSYRAVQRGLAGAALGLAGFLAGGLTGAAIEGTGCACDDPGLQGFMIGAPVGAAAGAILGVWLAR